MPSWAILVPTIPRRAESFVKLMNALLPQIPSDPLGWMGMGDVSVIAWLNDGTVPGGLGGIRDELLRYADLAGFEYASFIDDDDMVPPYYVSEIRKALAERPDHVGFPIQYRKDGEVKQARVEHSLKWKSVGWTVNRTARGEAALVRDFTHIDPIRIELARRGQFRHGDGQDQYAAEDRRWVRQVRPHLKTEVFIDKIMYYYDWRPAESSWMEPDFARIAERWNIQLAHEVRSPHLFWHPESL